MLYVVTRGMRRALQSRPKAKSYPIPLTTANLLCRCYPSFWTIVFLCLLLRQVGAFKSQEARRWQARVSQSLHTPTRLPYNLDGVS